MIMHKYGIVVDHIIDAHLIDVKGRTRHTLSARMRCRGDNSRMMSFKMVCGLVGESIPNITVIKNFNWFFRDSR